jgi:predicted Zn-dependent protease
VTQRHEMAILGALPAVFASAALLSPGITGCACTEKWYTSGARSRQHIGSHIERLKAKAAQSVSDGKLEDEVARLKRANQELRTKNRDAF